MKRTRALALIFACAGCAELGSDGSEVVPLEEAMTDDEVTLQDEINALGVSVDSTQAEVEAGFDEIEAMQYRLEQDQREGDSLRERIDANQREIDVILGQ